MQTLTFLAADYANIAEGGKLNVMGIFRSISSERFPTRHPSMYLVIKLGAELGEHGQKRDMSVILRDPLGKELLKTTGEIEVPYSQSGLQSEINILLNLRDVVFPIAGPFQFILFIDKDQKGSLDIDVIERKSGHDNNVNQGK